MKISIITISYNSARHMEQTIRSVSCQTYPNKEYIIIDGGSTDSTPEIIRKHSGSIDKWVSEPDLGISDAMNKGVALATGDFVIFLHSDDFFVDENILSVAASQLSSDCEIFLFNIFLAKNGESQLFVPKGLNWCINFKTGVFHQSTICARSLFEKIGNFDTNFRIAMDYDFFLRAYRAGTKAKKNDKTLSVMRLSGVSSQLDWPSLRERFAEEKRVHEKNCPSMFLRLGYLVYWSFYPLYRYLKS